MRSSLGLAGMLALAGCTSSGEVAGVKTAKDTGGLMLTTRPVDQVAQCIAAVFGSAAQAEGSGYAITVSGALPAVYHVRPFDDDLHRYSTIVEISGSTVTAGGLTPASCLVSGSGSV